MTLNGGNFRFLMATGELLRLEAPGAVQVVCESGRLWITEESRTRDLWLGAGDSVLLQGQGLALLEAVQGGQVRIADAILPG